MNRLQKKDFSYWRLGNEDDNDEDETEEEDSFKEAGKDILIGKMLKTRKILISGEINKALAEKTIRQLLLLDDMDKEPIQIFIDSPGGDADAGYAIFDMIRFIKSQVWTIGMGLVASAAAIIQLASPKDRRMGLPNSHYLIHQPLSGIRGVATDIEIHARELDKLRLKINRLISEETGHPFEQVEKDTDRDYWMNADEAAQYGLISKVIIRADELPVFEKEKPPTEARAKPKSPAKPGTKAASEADAKNKPRKK